MAAGHADAGARRPSGSVEACVPGRGPKVVFSGPRRRRSPARSKARSPPPATSWSATRATTAWIRWCRCSFPKSTPTTSALLGEQRQSKGWTGAIVTNPNCSTIVLAMALAPLRAVRHPRRGRHDDAGGVGRRVSRRAVARHPRQRRAVHRRRGREDGERDAEDSRQRWRPRAASGGRQRAHQSRAGHRRAHDDGVGGVSQPGPTIDDVVEAMRAFRGRPQELRLPTAPQPADRTSRPSRTGRSRGSTPISAAA